MKKTLLTLALTLLGLSVSAANIIEDWTQAAWAVSSWTANDKTPVNYTSTFTNIEYTFMGAYAAKTGLNANNRTSKVTGYVSFALPIDCSEIILSCTSAVKFNFYANNNQIGTTVSVTKGNEYTINIPTEYRAKGTVYKVESKSNSLITISKFTYVEATGGAKLQANEKMLEFAVPLKGNQSATLTGLAENIDGNISVAVDNDNFALSAASVTADELKEGVTVTYMGTTAGETTATLTLSAGDLKAEVALKGVTAANEGTEDDPLTVADVLAMNNLNPGPFYVTGTIGDLGVGGVGAGGMVTEALYPSDDNLILKDSDDKMIAVQLPATGEIREKLNIVTNPGNIGKTVVVHGLLNNSYYSATGVTHVDSYKLSGTTGIADIVADDANAPVEFFNLQGIRVENPEAGGLYIRRQGSKVGKVLVK